MNIKRIINSGNKLLNALGGILEIDVPQVLYYYKDMDVNDINIDITDYLEKNSHGGYDEKNQCIFINLDNITVRDIPNILAHEMFHAYQFFCINNKEIAKNFENEDIIDIWQWNALNYISSNSGVRYSLQPLEIFAICFENHISFLYCHRFLEYMKDMLDEDKELCLSVVEIFANEYPKELLDNWFEHFNVNFEIDWQE